ncbi:hypothetical protein M5K25_011932 [Dendrobium thyrsiflorum]|uniref:Peptidase C1A papain C-terminal domain-containing protein n=1 Tax=Dendrobium thyrsiflorum TaxID=117978 RepID=A0ABD0VAY3_DENTH
MAGKSPNKAALLLLLLAAAIPSELVIAVKPIPQMSYESKILEDSIVEKVNGNPAAGWKASINTRFSNYTVSQFKYILGVKQTPRNILDNIPVKKHARSLNLPKEFDARRTWSQCSTIGRILGNFPLPLISWHDSSSYLNSIHTDLSTLPFCLIIFITNLGHCGSCWAFGAVEALSDRFCVLFGMVRPPLLIDLIIVLYSTETNIIWTLQNISLSVNDLLACCGFLCGGGCAGGYPISAWRYFVNHGVVTEECDPYFDQIGCDHPGCTPVYPTPQCMKKCHVKNLLWEENKRFSVNAYRINNDVHDIMAEVYQNGPVEVAFTVYEDFAHYKSGVYRHIIGDVLGGHAVKLIGWGTSEQGEDYWLLANQWNRNWGDDGYFKILRGTNECGIEEDVIAGLPSSKNLIKNSAEMDAATGAST